MRFRTILISSLAWILVLTGCSSGTVVPSGQEVEQLMAAITDLEYELEKNGQKLDEVLSIVETIQKDNLEEEGAQGDDVPSRPVSTDPFDVWHQITIQANESHYVEAANLFMQEYCRVWIQLSDHYPDNGWAINAIELVGQPELVEVKQHDTWVEFSFTIDYAVEPLPQHYDLIDWMAGNTIAMPKKQGWYWMGRYVTLAEDASGNVTCLSVGTGR